MFALPARAAETTNSSGVLTLARYVDVDQNSGEWKRVLSTAGMSPPLERNRFCHAIDEGLRRIVGDESDGELAADELGGGGLSGEHVEELAAFHFAVVFDFLAEDFLGAGLVAIGVEGEVLPPTSGRSMVQPVRTRATCVTSAWV